FLILEAFVRHDVAPVAGGVADRKQDRFVAVPGLGERIRPPRPPVDGVVFVLQKVWAAFAREPIFTKPLSGGGHAWFPESGFISITSQVGSGRIGLRKVHPRKDEYRFIV